VTILKDPLILKAFKRAPYGSAMSLAFRNASEVRCSSKAQAVLMYNPVGLPRWFLGNCIGPGAEGLLDEAGVIQSQ
jgi:hypothetical protein